MWEIFTKTDFFRKKILFSSIYILLVLFESSGFSLAGFAAQRNFSLPGANQNRAGSRYKPENQIGIILQSTVWTGFARRESMNLSYIPVCFENSCFRFSGFPRSKEFQLVGGKLKRSGTRRGGKNRKTQTRWV